MEIKITKKELRALINMIGVMNKNEIMLHCFQNEDQCKEIIKFWDKNKSFAQT